MLHVVPLTWKDSCPHCASHHLLYSMVWKHSRKAATHPSPYSSSPVSLYTLHHYPSALHSSMVHLCHVTGFWRPKVTPPLPYRCNLSLTLPLCPCVAQTVIPDLFIFSLFTSSLTFFCFLSQSFNMYPSLSLTPSCRTNTHDCFLSLSLCFPLFLPWSIHKHKTVLEYTLIDSSDSSSSAHCCMHNQSAHTQCEQGSNETVCACLGSSLQRVRQVWTRLSSASFPLPCAAGQGHTF